MFNFTGGRFGDVPRVFHPNSVAALWYTKPTKVFFSFISTCS